MAERWMTGAGALGGRVLVALALTLASMGGCSRTRLLAECDFDPRTCVDTGGTGAPDGSAGSRADGPARPTGKGGQASNAGAAGSAGHALDPGADGGAPRVGGGAPDAGQPGLDDQAGQPAFTACELAAGDCRSDFDACPDLPQCTGTMLQGFHWSTSRVRIYDVAAGADGRIAIGGYYEGSLDFGGASTPLPASSEHDGFVAMLDNDGKAIWAYAFPGTGAQEVTGLAFLSDGTLIVRGANDPAAIDDTYLPLGDGFVAKLDADGKLSWSKAIVGGQIVPRDIAINSEGTAILNRLYQQLTFGELQLSFQGGQLYGLGIDAAGTGVWARQSVSVVGEPYLDSAGPIALDGSDSVLTVGTNAGPAPLSGWLRKVDHAGSLLFDKVFIGSDYAYAQGVAVNAKGDFLVTGAFYGDLTVDDTVLSSGNVVVGGGFIYDGWVAKFSSDGAKKWLHHYASHGSTGVEAYTAGADASGNFLVAGNAGASTIEGERIDPKRNSLTVLKLRPDGRKLWLRTFAATQSVLPSKVIADPSGNVWVAGYYDGALDLGTGNVVSPFEDGFLLKLAP